MASAVDICNLALAHLGNAANIAAISPPDGSAEADHCKRFYPIARDVCLQAHTWGFATKRAPLAELAGTPPDNWQRQYTLPADCLQPLAILLPYGHDDSLAQPFAVEALASGTQVLYTNVPEAVLRYSAQIVDTTKFSPTFVSALSWLLASYLAGPVIKGKAGAEAKTAAYRVYKTEIADAARHDANAARNTTYRDGHRPDWIVGR